MKRHSKRYQGGMIAIAILAVSIFFSIATIALIFSKNVKKLRVARSDGFPITVMRDALARYVTVNKASFQNGKEIMYINDQNSPTITELSNLGFLSQAGIAVQWPDGSDKYKTLVRLNPNQSLDGIVYMTKGFTRSDGSPDYKKACSIAVAIGNTGICNSAKNLSQIGNGVKFMTIPAPGGQPAIAGALIFVAK